MSEDQGVQATRAAVDAVTEAVRSFARRSEQVGHQAVSGARQFEERVADEHRRRVDELKRAKATRDSAAAALDVCSENCAGLERALAQAEMAVETATKRADASAKALAQAGEAIAAFVPASRSFTTALAQHAPQAVANTRQLSNEMGRYLASNGSSRANDRATIQAVRSGPQSGNGVTEVCLSDIINDRQGPLGFEKASREQVAWGLDCLKSVVEPALKMGKGADYFTARDATEGLAGERSYTGVYNWFYNSDHAIKLTRASGGYVVSNGYHRLAVARELGIDSLPAIVR